MSPALSCQGGGEPGMGEVKWRKVVMKSAPFQNMTF